MLYNTPMNIKNIQLPSEEHFHFIRENGKLLIFPFANPEWTTETMIFRSSVWDEQTGELISASYPKFFNWGERTDLSPLPSSLKNASLIEKIDGSTIIISKYKDSPIIRTRGSHSYLAQNNANEIPELLKKYPKILDNYFYSKDYSMIFEWVTPTNTIVLQYPEPDLILTGIIAHSNYSLFFQNNLDDIAQQIGVKRPQRFHFNSVDEMIKSIQELDGKEGICVYFHNDQEILKLKSLSYLKRHRFKFLCSDEEVIDLFLHYGKPNYLDFYQHIENEFDYECAQMAKGFMSRICDAYKEVENIIQGFKKFVENLPHEEGKRKHQAELILGAYGKTTRSGYVFQILDGKQIDDKGIKKLLMQVLK